MISYFTFLIYLFLIMLIGYWVNVLTGRMTGGWIYRILVAPGVVVHELSHALGCLIIGARIQSINVFKREGGELKHTGSPIPVVGNVIISLMPIVVGAGILYLISKNSQFSIFQSLADYLQVSNLQSIFQLLNFQTNTYDLRPIAYSLTSWQFWAFLYLIFNLIATMAPSKQDIKIIWWDLLTLTGIGYLLTLLGITIKISAILPLMILSIIYSIIVLLVVGTIYLIFKII